MAATGPVSDRAETKKEKRFILRLFVTIAALVGGFQGVAVDAASRPSKQPVAVVHKHKRHRHHLRLGPVEYVNPTWYSVGICDHGLGETTADGSHVYFGEIASEYLPMHTLIRFEARFRGRRFFRVRDTGAPFDIWLPCDGSPKWVPDRVAFRRVIG